MNKQSNKQSLPKVVPRRLKGRHFFVFITFLLVVLLPTFTVSYYLYTRAKDQYASTFAFSVRSADTKTTMDLLGGLSALGSISSSDTDILNEYLNSQSVVRALNDLLDLKTIYSEHYDEDPWFSFKPNGTIEDLDKYWQSLRKIYYDQGGGFIEVRVNAFDALTANKITGVLLELCTEKINKLNQVTRADTIKYARQELNAAELRLKFSRTELTKYRSINKLADPKAEIEIVASVIGGLEKQLSELLVELNLLSQRVSGEDIRVLELKQKIEIIRSRIIVEREKFSLNKSEITSFSKIVEDFEGLIVDKEYAEQAYLAALANFDTALANAERQSRYLATYIEPTVAEKAEYPLRFYISALAFAFSFLVWGTFSMVFYAIKDRR